MRIVIADDEALLREGLSRLLAEVGQEVVATVGDVAGLFRAIELDAPQVALVDIKMPPTHTDEGLAAALQIRQRYPHIGVLVLSHYLDARYALRLIEQHPGGVGYLLKERVSAVPVLIDALRRVAEDECVVDPTIVARLMRRTRRDDHIGELSDRERQVLALIAEGLSNRALADRLGLSPRTVERHIGHIFDKLGLEESEHSHRRVLAVLTLLRSA